MSRSINIKTLQASFTHVITPAQIRQWRGAFIEMAGWENDLFHNHEGAADKYHYRYPLIQYRIWDGKAGIFAINQGVEAFQEALYSTDWNLQWKATSYNVSIDNLRLDSHPLEMLEEPRHYTLHKYLPFNQDNYRRWQSANGMIQRIAILEEVLVGHILCFATAMDYQLPDRLEVNLQNIQDMRCLKHKVPMLAFDLEFSANIQLPFGIGLGKSVSHGYGQCRPQKIRRPRIKQNQSKSQFLSIPS